MKERIPLYNRHIDPRIRNSFIDSCAFDPKYYPEDNASKRIFELYQQDSIILEIAHSNMKEIEHPNTPNWVKKEARSMIYTLPTNLVESEIKEKGDIHNILTGNGKPEKMLKDAEHIFEASKHCGYFITVDERILKMRSKLHQICNATIVKPTEFLTIYDSYPSV